MRQLIGLCVLLVLLAAYPTFAADGAGDLPVYSIQVRAVPLADGTDLRCLACNRQGQSAVRWFVWHPSEDRVPFVEGSSLGTIPVGGGLFSAETDGTIRTIIPADPSVGWEQYEEIAGPLRIEDGLLHFRRVRWLDDNFVERRITDDRLPIDAL